MAAPVLAIFPCPILKDESCTVCTVTIQYMVQENSAYIYRRHACVFLAEAEFMKVQFIEVSGHNIEVSVWIS